MPIDGIRFENCTFSGCKLIFKAEEPVAFEGCTFIDCSWVFEGHALATLQFLSVLRNGLGSEGVELVDTIYSNINDGQLGSRLFSPQLAVAS